MTRMFLPSYLASGICSYLFRKLGGVGVGRRREGVSIARQGGRRTNQILLYKKDLDFVLFSCRR